MKSVLFAVLFFLFLASLSAQYVCVPESVSGVNRPTLTLNGTWKFNPDPPADFQYLNKLPRKWQDIKVPGEWVMQGFHVMPGRQAAYVRTFDLPADWEGKKIMLRCDAVFSRAGVWVNGHKAGSHLGGMTAFETDVTPYLKKGQKNLIAIGVTAETLADTLMSGSQYAAHSLGGILRKIYLYALPEIYMGNLSVTTSFDGDYRNATLVVKARFSKTNDKADKARIDFQLFDPQGIEIALPDYERSLNFSGKTDPGDHTFSFPVTAPEKWDPEHPNLYHLLMRISSSSGEETVEKRIGFRTIEVVGNKLFINGIPVKMRGVNRHETHPLLGRSLNDTLWHRDAVIFKNGNVNYIRTSHYPPAEEFIRWCDSLGFIVELENPFCWVGHGANATWKKEDSQAPSLYPYLKQVAGEDIGFYRNHPSVIIWSMANESTWGPNWARLLKYYQKTDPTRPETFHDQAYGSYNNHKSVTPIAVYHYPGPDGASVADTFPRPLLFGEYCHINCYNRREIAADPGVRDAWGRGFLPMWDKVYKSTGGLGGAIWAGIDDVFYLPEGKAVGYGEWGVIDGWRRKKPEYYHMKKAYAPVRIINKQVKVPGKGEPVKLEIENRFDFTNLKECRIVWQIDGKQGEAKANVEPGRTGILRIDPGIENLAGKEILVSVFSPQNILVDRTLISIGKRQEIPEPFMQIQSGKIRLDSTSRDYLVEGEGFLWKIDRNTGMIRTAEINGKTIMAGGPDLMMLPLTTGPCVTDFKLDIPPLNNLCNGRKLLGIMATEKQDTVRITLKVSWYEARGTLVYDFTGDGSMNVSYSLVSEVNINPRQWGMVFSVTRETEHLEWYRKGLWTVYPEDHIGRPHGMAVPFVTGSYKKPVFGAPPAGPWYHDANELGSNDFRSSKDNVYRLSLTDDAGSGIVVKGDGKTTVRSWVEGDKISFLVARFSTGGGDLFFSSHYRNERRPLKRGNPFSGKVKIKLVEKGK